MTREAVDGQNVMSLFVKTSSAQQSRGNRERESFSMSSLFGDLPSGSLLPCRLCPGNSGDGVFWLQT
jgi:hypothetical protein